MAVTSGKQLLLLGALAVCVSAALCDSTFENGVMPMSAATASTVRNQLLHYVNHRQVAPPPNVFCDTCLIKAWQRRYKNSRLFTFMLKDLNQAVMNYPAPVQTKLRALAYAVSNTFENFEVDIQKTHAVKTAYIGAARRVGDLIDVAMLDVDIEATLVQKYITLSRRECKKILWVKRCKTIYWDEPRGYHADEINSMTTMLESEAFTVFKEIVMAMPA